MPEQDELDLLIDSTVSSYGDPGPGLEERVLARIDAEGVHAAKRRWLPWAIALPIAAGVLLLLVLSSHRRTQPQLVRHDKAPLTQQPEMANASPETSKVHRPVRRESGLPRRNHLTAGRAAPLPKLDVFPTPRPLTPEEKALVTFAAKASEAERQSFIEAQKQADAPLSIASITIQPLDPPDHGGN